MRRQVQFLVSLLPLSGCALAPAPADPDALNWPPHEPLVNGRLVTIEVIHVNGQEAPGRSLEKAIQGFSKYVAGDVRTMKGRPVHLDVGENGLLTSAQLDPVVAGRGHQGPSDVTILLVPGLSDFQYAGFCQFHPDGSHVITLDARRVKKRIPFPVPHHLVWRMIIQHELLHALGVPYDRSHAGPYHHCTHPECLLYPRPDLRSVLTAILRLGPPLDLCRVCQAEIRRAQEAAGGRLVGPDEPYDHMKTLDALVHLNPRRPRPYALRAGLHERRKNYDEAVADLTKVIELDPENPIEYMYRGQVLFKRKDYQKAIDDLTRAIELDPGEKTAMCYRNRGVMFTQVRQFDRAIGDWEWCLQLDPDDARALNNLASVLATCPDDAIRDGSRAVELARRACELTEWNDAETLDTLAAACAEVGRFDEAVQHQTNAITLADDREVKAYRQHLELYRAGKPRRD